MYIAVVPNRNSPPAILLRQGCRENGKAKNGTLANLSGWSPERVEALRRALEGEFDGVLGDVDPMSDRIFGVLYVLNQLADRLGIVRALGNNRMGKLALFLVLARVAHQGSRLSAVRWAQNHCVAEILGLSDFHKRDLYLALDWVAQHQDRIEKKLFRAYAKNKGAPAVLVLYDVTSCYLEGDCNEFAEFGYDREALAKLNKTGTSAKAGVQNVLKRLDSCFRRNDGEGLLQEAHRDKKRGKKQIVIGLLTGTDGEPLAVKVFEGNTSDCTTVSTQIDIIE